MGIREVIVYNANQEKRNHLLRWVTSRQNSKIYYTNANENKEPFYLRFENEEATRHFKNHWLGELEFYDLDTYNGRAIQIGGKETKIQKFSGIQTLRASLDQRILKEISDWFKDNIPYGDYEETLIKNSRIRFIKKEEDINLFRLIWGHLITIEVKDYCNE